MRLVIFPHQMDWSVLDHFYIFYPMIFAFALSHFPNQMDWSVLDHLYIFFPMSFAYAHSHFSISDGFDSQS